MPTNSRGEDYATMPIGYIEQEYNSLYALTRDLWEKSQYKSISRETKEALYNAARSAEADMNRVKRLLQQRERAEGGPSGNTFPRTSPLPRQKSVSRRSASRKAPTQITPEVNERYRADIERNVATAVRAVKDAITYCNGVANSYMRNDEKRAGNYMYSVDSALHAAKPLLEEAAAKVHNAKLMTRGQQFGGREEAFRGFDD